MSKTCNALRLLVSSLVVLLAALVAPAQAQQFTGTLRGVVQDSTGGVLPGAAVSVTEISTTPSVRSSTCTPERRGAAASGAGRAVATSGVDGGGGTARAGAATGADAGTGDRVGAGRVAASCAARMRSMCDCRSSSPS